MTETPKTDETPSTSSVPVEAKEVNSSQTASTDKKKSNNTLIIVIAVVALLLLCCCCSFLFLSSSSVEILEGVQKELEKELEEMESELEQEVETGLDNTLPSEGSVVITVGEEKTNENVAVTLMTIENPFVYTGTLYNVSEGEKLVAVEVEMRNDGTLSEPVDPSFFQLRDSMGNTYEKSLMIARNPKLSSGTLEPGGVVSGWITFSVRESSTGFVLINEDAATGNQIEFQL